MTEKSFFLKTVAFVYREIFTNLIPTTLLKSSSNDLLIYL